MVFNSTVFLVFFTLVLFVYYLPLSWTIRKAWLLGTSYIFYGAWNPAFLLLLLFSTVIDYLASIWIAASSRRAVRVLWLLISLVANLGLLGFFKYGGFLTDNLTWLLATQGIIYSPPKWNVVLPVGISFYTFQTLSYTIDVYRRHLTPTTSFLDFALYVTFFPQLVAGPIVRATDFLPQCVEPIRATAQQIAWGLILLSIGLVEKVVLADSLLARVSDRVFNHWRDAGCMEAWTGAIAFSGQIFCDFSGYSLCAIGCALTMGFVMPDNFRFPYAAAGFSEFWGRWHVSLSTWLRDYVYFSLGGNRCGKLRTVRNLMATMLLGGLWHGASWTFVLWGALHGVFLVCERLIQFSRGSRQCDSKATRLRKAVFTYALVCITWVFFRAESVDSALYLVHVMLSGKGGIHVNQLGISAAAWAIVVGLFVGHNLMRDTTLEAVYLRMPFWLRVVGMAGLLLLLIMSPGDDRAFIYFQF